MLNCLGQESSFVSVVRSSCASISVRSVRFGGTLLLILDPGAHLTSRCDCLSCTWSSFGELCRRHRQTTHAHLRTLHRINLRSDRVLPHLLVCCENIGCHFNSSSYGRLFTFEGGWNGHNLHKKLSWNWGSTTRETLSPRRMGL